MADLKGPSSTGNYSTVAVRDLDSADLQFIKQYTAGKYDEDFLKGHIHKVHEEIRSSQHVYRCISVFSYLTPRSHHHPTARDRCLPALLADRSKKILDLGCCFGQEVRRLMVDGVQADQIYATDVSPVYWEAGKRLYLDDVDSTDLNRVTTFFGDWTVPLNEENSEDFAVQYAESFDFVLCWAVFHVLSKEQTDRMLRRIFKVLKSNGGILFGACRGAQQSQTWVRTPDNSSDRFLHDVSSLTTACEEAGFVTEKINVKPIDPKDIRAAVDRERKEESARSESDIFLGFSVEK